MPELAEVEFNRKQWNCGLGKTIRAVELHAPVRIFRQTSVGEMLRVLPRKKLLRSEAHGKQMLFRFSGDCWLGLHLGMTGRLRVEQPEFVPGKHDHLVLYQSSQALVFCDPRQFGRIRFHHGPTAPEWWNGRGCNLISRQFTAERMGSFLERHGRLSLKAALLLQSGFPGIGNWMADEILWRAGISPRRLARKLTSAEVKLLWEKLRFVCRQALHWVGPTYSELPQGWLFHERWEKQGRCPKHGLLLSRARIGGRTTAWCPICQKR